MKISMIGCGKLGLPVALAWASKGHDVVGYDISAAPREIMRSRKYPHLEPGAQALLDMDTQVRIADTVAQAVAHGDIVFIAVETPHHPDYEGLTRMPEERADFSYEALKRAFAAVAAEATNQKKHIVAVIISTALPGTCEREIVPMLDEYTSLVYAPMFIAQSTVVEDALNPEFVLLGVDKADERAIKLVGDFFTTMHDYKKLRFMSVASAEATKVAYNTSLGQKIVNANAWMEICHKTGADVDDVMDTLALATDRVVSAKYMRGGMGDGGGCHPRDVIALSHLAEKLSLSFDIGGMLAIAREKQTEWLADLAFTEAVERRLPIVLLGKSYKRGTNLVTGSPAILLKNILTEYEMHELSVEQWDPYVDVGVKPPVGPAVYVVAADHDAFYDMMYPAGSTIFDPWGKMSDLDGVKVVRIGRAPKANAHAEEKMFGK